MEKIARLILKYNKPLLALILILNLLSLYIVITRFSISGDIISFFRHGFKEATHLKK